MWVPKSVIDWFQISKDSVDELRCEVAELKTERDLYKVQTIVAETNANWMRSKINQLEMERAGLIEKAYNITLPAIPEIVRQTQEPFDPNLFPTGFEDIGEDVAKSLGLPSHTE
jgi:hypothetical protein